MPYKDASKKREWERRHKDVSFLESATWADGQIAMLRGMGIRHEDSEWKVLRLDLLHSRLNKATVTALHADPNSHR